MEFGVKTRNTIFFLNDRPNHNLLQEQTVAAQYAFTHRSFLSEAKIPLESNERLESLGDAVLEIVITEYLLDGSFEANIRRLSVPSRHGHV